MTGLRQNDILNLRKSQVDFESGDLILVQGKTQRFNRIPANETAMTIIRQWCDRHDSDVVFPSPRTGSVGTTLKTAMRAASRRAGLKRIGTRTLRRSFGTRLHELGWDDTTVAGLLGHRDLRSVHRYKRGTEIKRRAVSSLENHDHYERNRAKIVPDNQP